MSSPHGFVRVGRTADVPRLEGRSVALGDERVAIFNTEAGFVAIGNACPHQGGPLSDGIVSDRCVTCPLHGWRIDLFTGEVIGGEGRVPVHELAVLEGELYVRPLPVAAAT